MPGPGVRRRQAGPARPAGPARAAARRSPAGPSGWPADQVVDDERGPGDQPDPATEEPQRTRPAGPGPAPPSRSCPPPGQPTGAGGAPSPDPRAATRSAAPRPAPTRPLRPRTTSRRSAAARRRPRSGAGRWSSIRPEYPSSSGGPGPAVHRGPPAPVVLAEDQVVGAAGQSVWIVMPAGERRSPQAGRWRQRRQPGCRGRRGQPEQVHQPAGPRADPVVARGDRSGPPHPLTATGSPAARSPTVPSSRTWSSSPPSTWPARRSPAGAATWGRRDAGPSGPQLADPHLAAQPGHLVDGEPQPPRTAAAGKSILVRPCLRLTRNGSPPLTETSAAVMASTPTSPLGTDWRMSTWSSR